MTLRGSSDEVVGSKVAGYQIEGLIGRGGMGAVYRAQELGLGRGVALKVIAPELAEDSLFRERFLHESRVAASLDHPHVVPIFNAGEDDGVLFLAMRYIEGSDLGKLLAAEGALEPGRAVALIEQVAEALDAAHRQGLVHRDVKPSNVLIASAAGQEDCYLADFGLTKLSGSLSGVSAPGDVVGTLEYVAPEQITGDDVDPRADVYSLGCVLYECLTGTAPFPRATDVALLWAHVHEEPTPPSKARPELPRALDTVLARALAKDPARRYTSAGEFVAAARSALGLSVIAAPARRTRRWVLVGAVALAFVGILAGLAATRSGSESGLSSVSPNSVGVIDPATNELVAEVQVGLDPGPIAFGPGGVWVANVKDRSVSQINPATRERGRTFFVVSDLSDLTVGGGAVWAAVSAGPGFPLRRSGTSLDRFAPNLDQLELPRVTVSPVFESTLLRTVVLRENEACEPPRASLAFGARTLWFVCEDGDPRRIDPLTTQTTGINRRPGLLQAPEYSDAAFGLSSFWLVDRAANAIVEVDAPTNLVFPELKVGQAPSAIAVGPDALWVTNYDDDTVTRIALTESGATTRTTDFPDFPVGDGPVDVAVGEGGVWVASRLGRTVTRLNPETGEIVATIKLGNEPHRLAAGGGAVWVSVRTPEPAGG